jgi:multiple sugar transport system permease protein
MSQGHRQPPQPNSPPLNPTQPSATQPNRQHQRWSLAQRQAVWAYVFLVVRLLPAGFSFVLALFDYAPAQQNSKFIGFDNFLALANDPLFARSLWNTVLYTIVGVPVQLVFGIGIALMLQQVNRFQGVFRAIYFAPYVTPVVASAWVWQWLFNKNFGPVNTVLGWFGIPAQSFLTSPDQALLTVLGFVVWQQLGFQVVLFLAGLEAVPRTYHEAAALDGANFHQRFWYITLPLLNPTIVFSVVIATTGFLQLFAQVVNLNFGDQGGPLNSTLTVALYIYQQGFQSFAMGYASAVTVALFIIILLITIVQLYVLRRKVDY